MKKILLYLLLACSISTFAQAEFPEGIQVTNVQDNTALKVNVQNATGVINWKYLADFQKEKAILSTGLLKNGLISANGDPTKFNITAGIGIISNFDDPENPTSTIINFPTFTGITPTYLLTGTITYVAINSTPAVVMQATPFTPEQRRSLIVLGAVIHSNLTTINVLNNISAPSNANTNQLHDFIEAVGALNLTGNKYTANGANLQLNKSAGLIFKLGSNFANGWKNPHELAQTAGTSLTFRYRTQNGTEGSDRINLDPSLYDNNNVLTAVPNNKFTIQTVTMFQSGLTRIQYGQNVYDDLATAKNAVFTRNFVLEPNSKENGIIRAYFIMRNTTTSLQTVADADILEAQKFGGVASGGVALTLANIVTALGYTPENVVNKQNSLAVDGSGTKYPTVDAVNNALSLKTNTADLSQLLRYETTWTSGSQTFTLPNNYYAVSNVIVQGVSLSESQYTLTSANQVTINDPLDSGDFVVFIYGTNASANLAPYYTQAQVDALLVPKANTASPTFTGDPKAPTPTLGDNDTSVATTAFVLANSMALTGSQTATGRKTLVSDNTTAGGLQITNNKTTSTVYGDNAGLTIFGAGTNAILVDGSFGTGIRAVAGTSGTYGVFAGASGSGSAGFFSQNTGIARGIYSRNDSTGIGMQLENISEATGKPFQYLKAGNEKAYIDDSGNFSAQLILLKSYTVATLPAGVQGATAYVTDATAPTYLGALTGGGSVKCPVFYNGTAWVSH